MTTPELEPTDSNIANQVEKFNRLGHQLYAVGPRSDAHKAALLAERGRIRTWLRQFAPEKLPRTGP